LKLSPRWPTGIRRRSQRQAAASGGLGGMGGAQPLAATLNGAVFLGIEVDPARIERRVRTGYCDRIAQTLDEALDICEDAANSKKPSRSAWWKLRGDSS